jgi:hypothetical protein
MKNSGYACSAKLNVVALAALLVLVVTPPGVTSAGLDPVIDQEQVEWNIGASLGNNGYAQSFTPTMSVLAKVELQLVVWHEALGMVEMRIYGDDGTGYPDISTVLASQMLVPGPGAVDNGVVVDGWFIADFDDIDVIPGQRYYIWADTPFGVLPSGNWRQADGSIDSAYENLYEDGEAWVFVAIVGHGFAVPEADFTFRTYSYSVEVLDCEIDVKPEMLNLRSGSGVITSIVNAPEYYSVCDIDLSSIALNGVAPSPEYSAVTGDFDGDGELELRLKFDRAAILSTLDMGLNTLTLTGLISGLPMQGETNVLVRG